MTDQDHFPDLDTVKAILREQANPADDAALIRPSYVSSMMFTMPRIHDRPLDQRADTGAWLRKQLARYTYKPGFILTIHQNFGFGFSFLQSAGAEYSLQIVMKVEDTYHPGVFVEVGGRRPLIGAEHYTEDQFGKMLAAYIQELEIHEAREWLKRDGVIVDDPHKNV